MESIDFGKRFLALFCSWLGSCWAPASAVEDEIQYLPHQEFVLASYNLDIPKVLSLLPDVDVDRRGGINLRSKAAFAPKVYFDDPRQRRFNALLAVAASPGLDSPPPTYRDFARKRVAIAKILIDAGASLSVKDSEGRNALHIALMDGNEELAIFLLEQGISASQAIGPSKELLELTPLQLAARDSKLSTRITAELIRRGADVNATITDGSTLLTLARRTGSVDLVKLLLRNGANPFSVRNVERELIFPTNSEKAINELLKDARAKWRRERMQADQ